MQFKGTIFNAALLGASCVMAQSTPDPNVDVSVFELRAFSNETAIDGKSIVAKNGFLAVGTTSDANCTGDNADYDSTTYTQFLIGLTTYNPDGDAQIIFVGTNGQNLQVAQPGQAPAEPQVPTGFRQIVHWNDKLLQFRGAGFQACPRSNFDEWIVSVQPGALPTVPECNIFDVVIVPKDGATAPSCVYN
ncbi:general substrate transporter [Diplodia corticola]|uniref:General substrate transporter n=1 Tax=Diplodia corticola TaxID=236234 RepID=A0A1J9RE72_9PEZI|nr:general substrate transporter [Diplodia corticola]OJD38713.1 general substrate transporter [Diplodia corticola]